LTGYTESFGKGGDGWLIKTDANGNERWRKTFGRDNSDWIFSVEQTSDDGFILREKQNLLGLEKAMAGSSKLMLTVAWTGREHLGEKKMTPYTLSSRPKMADMF